LRNKKGSGGGSRTEELLHEKTLKRKPMGEIHEPARKDGSKRKGRDVQAARWAVGPGQE